jgi:transcription-repair coupling factor (superfamily II helicase)
MSGFGKTEVAVRAAFKAVMDGKQVAVLAPTTVLAQQHFEVFRQRMLDYPRAHRNAQPFSVAIRTEESFAAIARRWR